MGKKYLNSPDENPNYESFVGLLSDLMREIGYNKWWVKKYLNNPQNLKKLEAYAMENPNLHSGELLWAYLDICGFRNPNGTFEDGVALLWEIVMVAGAIGLLVGIGVTIPAIPGLSVGFTKALVIIGSMMAIGYGGSRSLRNTIFKTSSTAHMMTVNAAAKKVIEEGKGH